MDYIESQTLSGHDDFINCIAVINKKTIASGSDDSSIKILDIISGKVIKTLYLYGACTCIAVINEDTLVSGDDGDSLIIWNFILGEKIKILTRGGEFSCGGGCVGCPSCKWGGNTDDIVCVAMIDEKTIVSGSHANSLKIWNTETGKVIKKLIGHSDIVFFVLSQLMKTQLPQVAVIILSRFGMSN